MYNAKLRDAILETEQPFPVMEIEPRTAPVALANTLTLRQSL